MRYYLWISEKQDGPYHSDGIRRMLIENKISQVTLASPENGNGEWVPVSSIEEITKQQPQMASGVSKYQIELPPIKESIVARVLTFIAALDFIGALAGAAIYSNDEKSLFAVCFLVSGILGGLILLGFAKVIENTYETSQRLRQITILIQNSMDDRK